MCRCLIFSTLIYHTMDSSPRYLIYQNDKKLKKSAIRKPTKSPMKTSLNFSPQFNGSRIVSGKKNTTLDEVLKQLAARLTPERPRVRNLILGEALRKDKSDMSTSTDINLEKRLDSDELTSDQVNDVSNDDDWWSDRELNLSSLSTTAVMDLSVSDTSTSTTSSTE